MRIGSWEVNIGPSKEVPQSTLIELEAFLSGDWLAAIKKEIKKPWWGIERLGIPSPLVRVDISPLVGKGERATSQGIYEVEVRPAGLGLVLSLDTFRHSFWREIFRSAGCCGFIKIESTIADDQIAAAVLQMPFYEFYEQIPEITPPYWVRTNLRRGSLAETLEKVSLVPISSDGDKSYLLRLGLATMVNKDTPLDWNKSFVVKPLIGARMEGVEIYIPSREVKGMVGVSTKSRVLRSMDTNQTIIQDFIPPLEEEIKGIKGWTIWRLYFGWLDGKYKFVGGLWNWRPNIRVHGSSDAVFGLLEIRGRS